MTQSFPAALSGHLHVGSGQAPLLLQPTFTGDREKIETDFAFCIIASSSSEQSSVDSRY